MNSPILCNDKMVRNKASPGKYKSHQEEIYSLLALSILPQETSFAGKPKPKNDSPASAMIEEAIPKQI